MKEILTRNYPILSNVKVLSMWRLCGLHNFEENEIAIKAEVRIRTKDSEYLFNDKRAHVFI